ncbi:MAG: class I SAM-dependent methyltransferase family protein [Candidatus Bathyarchaeota archaeon]|uniref:class I SAM-dependent methyltransferase n=1 Tax=Candidatus Bathycorpusculum sp. TaxID=2994959 RepID=UPI0028291531|nr:class I SAM-dependent methyltransferase family protein [Candidatus Termiticorpusculum sp.]MCL2257340.1 class I SAM-dependent methyltransferase family protein [Candidatus Termiticorpusculum sp.]MCL2292549.1 class I SAM-dependent methyltransferase family protein [Candidatus Termiticorpusculum sp.]
MINTVCLKVPKDLGEKVISLAHKLDIVDKTLLIERSTDGYLWVPLVRQLCENELSQLKNLATSLVLSDKVFSKKRLVEETLTQALERQIPNNLHYSIPHALDIIGDVAIIEISFILHPYQTIIGQTILKTHKNIKCVYAKAGAISGVYRTRDLSYVAGENRTRTVYNEYGCQYYVDLAKAYFSPRLSQEHHRVASLVTANETIVDLFAGVGPFAVPIGKLCPKSKVYAIDINPDAVDLLKINIYHNKVTHQVSPLLGDARELANNQLRGVADRVIMNLPETAIDFVDVACQTLKPTGGLVHFYGFVRKPDTVEDLKTRFTHIVEQQNRNIDAFRCVKCVRETAPYEQQVVLDVQIK